MLSARRASQAAHRSVGDWWREGPGTIGQGRSAQDADAGVPPVHCRLWRPPGRSSGAGRRREWFPARGPDPVRPGEDVGRGHLLRRPDPVEERPEHPGVALDRPTRARATFLLGEERVRRPLPTGIIVTEVGGKELLGVHRRDLGCGSGRRHPSLWRPRKATRWARRACATVTATPRARAWLEVASLVYLFAPPRRAALIRLVARPSGIARMMRLATGAELAAGAPAPPNGGTPRRSKRSRRRGPGADGAGGRSAPRR